jgi:PAS domain S-box-containing protein
MSPNHRPVRARPRDLCTILPPPGPPGTPANARGGRDGGAETPARARQRLRQLYEVSKLLLCFESVEQTLSSVFAVMAETLALRSAFLLYDAHDQLCSHAWRADDVSLVGLRLAEMHARRCYAYLAGERAGAAPDARGVTPLESVSLLPVPPRAHRGQAESPLALPLVVGRGRVFGALHLVVRGRLDEPSLLFINAVVNEIAIALYQQAATQVERAWVEGRWRELARKGAAAEMARERAELGRDLAEALRNVYEAQLDFSRSVTDSLGEGVLAVDATARVTFLNPAAELLLGRPCAEVLGAPVQSLLGPPSPRGASPLPEGCPLVSVLRTGEPARSDEATFCRRDGAPFPARYTASPIRRAGRVSGAVIVFQDVTALKRSENAQRFLAEASAALTASLDPEQTLATAARLPVPFLADACHLERFDDGAASRAAFADGPPPDAPHCFALEPLWREARAAALKTGRAQLLADLSAAAPPAARAASAASRDGGLASLMAVPLRARGRLLGLLSLATHGAGRRYSAADLALAEDLARRVAAAVDNARSHQEAQRAVRHRQDVLAVVSHDLRAPLGTVLMSATLLSEPCDDEPTRRKTLEKITRSVAQMDRLIKDLLDMSSIDAGHLALDRRPHPLGALVDDALEALRPLAARKSLQLDARVPDQDLSLVCDRWRVVQVFSNLIGNAIKFTPEGGTITLRAEPRGRDVRFSVADTGPGIARERLPHVFERYWQADETAKAGTGLGLYICKGIVEAHGGAMSVESEAGRGSTFFFTLPLVPPAKSDDVARPAYSAAAAGLAQRPSEAPPPGLLFPPAPAFKRP